ncbi:MAG TPA: hypothetical protein DIU39_05560 [Flavobacteriales bacterium]|nr:hypothetical protein [Flavobacteriales bacterium]
MKTFVTIFPYLRNEHLIKDVGQIPHFLSENYNTKLVAYDLNQSFTHTSQEAKNLPIELVKPNSAKKVKESAMANYIRENASKIDVLNLYHLTIETFIFIIIYKKNNPQGKVYIKADVYNDNLINTKYSHNFIKNIYYRNIERQAMKIIDIVTVENKKAIALFKKRYPEYTGKLFYLPNGVNDVFIENNLHILPFENKQNRILVSGRIGAPEKNHEIILQVLPKLNLKEWEIVFAGPVQPSFQQKVEIFYDENPQLREKVIFTGEIIDRLQLYDLYNKSKVLCLTSEKESFGLAFTEALYFGNYLIGTEGMFAFDDITDNGKYGTKLPFNNQQALQNTLQQIIDGKITLQDKCASAKKYAVQNFTWSKITRNLSQLLNE